MNSKDCNTLEKVYTKPPPNVPWSEVKSLLKAVADDYNGAFHPVSSRIRVTLKTTPLGEDFTLTIEYVPIAYRGVVENIEDFLAKAGVPLCST